MRSEKVEKYGSTQKAGGEYKKRAVNCYNRKRRERKREKKKQRRRRGESGMTKCLGVEHGKQRKSRFIRRSYLGPLIAPGDLGGANTELVKKGRGGKARNQGADIQVEGGGESKRGHAKSHVQRRCGKISIDSW